MIGEGNFADLVVFDALKVVDLSTSTPPEQFSVDTQQVLVNGCCVWPMDGATGERQGRVVRRVA